MILSRRSLITGLVSLVAAPAIVRASSLMPVKTWVPLEGATAYQIALLQDEFNKRLKFVMDHHADLTVNPPLIVERATDKVIGKLVCVDVNRQLYDVVMASKS